MKKLLFILTFFIAGLVAHAQRVYFIYIQSENTIPFFVKMNQKVQSSSPSGYIILSGLKDSTYNFSVGFPGKTEENKFSVTVNKEDRGFLLKTLGNENGLFDLQTLKFYKAIAGVKQPELNIPELMAKADPFTRLLSQATDDPYLLTISGPNPGSIKQNLAKSNEPSSVSDDQAVAELLKDSAAVAKTLQEKPAITLESDTTVTTIVMSLSRDTLTAVPDKIVKADVEPVNSEPEKKIQATLPEPEKQTAEIVYNKSIVTRRSESSTTEGFGLVFLDNSGQQTDTIRLLIPNPKIVARIQQPVKQEEIMEEKPVQTSEVKATLAEPGANTCADVATDKDFLKLRKGMAAEESETEMLKTAVKYFEKKCFSTEQIKNLSALFLTASAKYDFFNAAYAHTSDKQIFASLQSELKDDYYAGRFRDLVGGR